MKIAISLPKEEFLLLEKIKGHMHISRSKLIQQALSRWLEGYRQKALVNKYVQGYKRKPDKLSKVTAFEKAEFNALTGNEDWR